MSYQVLARKYRPQRFSDVIGQDHVTRTLKNAIEQQRIAHGYIFSGHRGIGKTTIARILAMALNCQSSDRPVPEPCGECDSCREIRSGTAVDVIEIDAATNRGIDEIRELREAARYRPARDRYKIYILDEAHQITDAAFNALLKTLEEPPAHIIFMMATTAPEDIPQTIRSRCQHFSFHAVRFDDIVAQLRGIAGQEGITADEDALALLAEAGDGSMRDALSIMDQAIAACGNRLETESVRGLMGTVSSDILEHVLQGVHDNSSEGVLLTVDRLLVEGHSPLHFAKQAVRFLRNAIVAKVAGRDSSLLQISSDERARVSRVAEMFSEEDLARFLQIMLRTHSDLGYKQEQRFHLELGLLKMVHAQRLLPMEELLSEAAAALPSSVTLSSARSREGGAPGRASTSAASSSTPRPSPFETDQARRSATSSVARPSPFENDRERKSGPKAETNGPAFASAPVPTQSYEPRCAPESSIPLPAETAVAVLAAEEPAGEVTADTIREAVLQELENAGQTMLTHALERGAWLLKEHEIVVKVAMSQTMIDLSVAAEAKNVMNATLLKAAGRGWKISVVPGGNPNQEAAPRSTAANGPSARSRALQNPLVHYMKEKFGAEVRTVIDQKDKR